MGRHLTFEPVKALQVNRMRTPIYTIRERRTERILWQGFAWDAEQAREFAIRDGFAAASIVINNRKRLDLLPSDFEEQIARAKCYREGE